MAKSGLPKGSGKRLKVREKSVKSQGILKWILSGNPELCYQGGETAIYPPYWQCGYHFEMNMHPLSAIFGICRFQTILSDTIHNCTNHLTIILHNI